MIPTVGRIVHYTLLEEDVSQVVTNRAWQRGTLGRGNDPRAGDVLPMIITRILAPETEAVQGQVFLDGADTLWVSRIRQGDGPGQFHEPPRIPSLAPRAGISDDDPVASGPVSSEPS